MVVRLWNSRQVRWLLGDPLGFLVLLVVLAVVGLAIGSTFPSESGTFYAGRAVKLYIKSVIAIVKPYIFCSIFLSIYENRKDAGWLMAQTVGVYTLTTVNATTLGMLFGALVFGRTDLRYLAGDRPPDPQPDWIDHWVKLPVIGDIDFLSIILIGLTVGLVFAWVVPSAVVHLRKRLPDGRGPLHPALRASVDLGDALERGCARVQDLIQRLLGYVVKVVPFVVLLTFYAAGSAFGPEVVTGPIGMLILGSTIAMGVHVTMLMVFLLWRFRRPALEFMKTMRTPIFEGMAARSSGLALPMMQKHAREAGLSEPVVNFTFPFGSTTNMDGTACVLGFMTVMTFQGFYGVGLSPTMWAATAVFIVIGSAATASAPSASLAILTYVLLAVAPWVGAEPQPLYTNLALMLAIAADPISDTFRTGVNLTGDSAASLYIDRTNGEFERGAKATIARLRRVAARRG